MSDVIVIGDGPAGLSCGLFLAKNGKSVEVFAQDKTLMHLALLINYLGIPRMTGTEFQKIARKQVIDQGGTIINAEVTGVACGGAAAPLDILSADAGKDIHDFDEVKE